MNEISVTRANVMTPIMNTALYYKEDCLKTK
jgi:hypothetical protein